MIERKRSEEAEILKGVRDLNEFIFAVPKKYDKRTMVKWKTIQEFENDFY